MAVAVAVAVCGPAALVVTRWQGTLALVLGSLVVMLVICVYPRDAALLLGSSTQ